MSSLVRALSSQVAAKSSRQGFLAMIGKAAMVGGAIIAGLGVGDAFACGPSCGDCPCPCCSQHSCLPPDSDVYVSCCKTGNTWYETRKCLLPDGSLNCYYSFQSIANCPRLREGVTPAP
jgi:hypothetical protein